MEKKDRWDEINAVFEKAAKAKALEKLKKEMEEFEAGFPDGVYAVPSDPKGPRLKVHEMYAYCKKKGVNPENLSEEEMEQFLECDDAMLEKMDRFEKGFPDGVYVEPGGSKEPRVKVRALFQYCNERGVDPIDLTDEEREQFFVYPDHEGDG